MVDVCDITSPLTSSGLRTTSISVQTAINKAISWLDYEQPEGA